MSKKRKPRRGQVDYLPPLVKCVICGKGVLAAATVMTERGPACMGHHGVEWVDGAPCADCGVWVPRAELADMGPCDSFYCAECQPGEDR